MGRPKGSKNKTHIAKVELTCEHCGVGFERYPSQIARPGQGRFCSGPCQRRGTAPERRRFGVDHPRWRGGTEYRRRAFEAFGERCRECGYDQHVELLWVHHKDFKGRKERQDHSLENLEVLCIRCHLEKHLEARHPISEQGSREIHVE